MPQGLAVIPGLSLLSLRNGLECHRLSRCVVSPTMLVSVQINRVQTTDTLIQTHAVPNIQWAMKHTQHSSQGPGTHTKTKILTRSKKAGEREIEKGEWRQREVKGQEMQNNKSLEDC